MSPETSSALGAEVAPLKASVFIDGTWLFYSIYSRQDSQCTVTKRFGKGWYHYYEVDWAALPSLICAKIRRQAEEDYKKKNEGTKPRPIEISRVSVYTSYRKGTEDYSPRVKMFQRMAEANMNVQIMETNRREKCVDIQLAVEMLYYAYTPEAFDIAILVSGDKDFVPALVNTRKNGKLVAIASMHMGCNRGLYEHLHVKDFEVVWIDEFLNKLIRPIKKRENLLTSANRISKAYPRLFSQATLKKLIYNYIIENSLEKKSNRVTSRQLGRYLKERVVGHDAGILTNLLEQVKVHYGGLRLFLAEYPSIFLVIDKYSTYHHNKSYEFWIEAVGNGF